MALAHDDDLGPRFPLEGAVVGKDDRTGDVVIYAGNGAASKEIAKERIRSLTIGFSVRIETALITAPEIFN